ncbi:MAG: betaine/proline/choline family ABC transporter ATP-binding protein [Actinomycetota bacterium]|nr:betaine/proline/choline family ABC transporter ATP-binding protein [Actinomycetota bacterium]
MTDSMIRLEEITKRYRGQSEPAVEELTMDVLEGETCVLVGPSGCGKTTTMKMINRIIEPSSGRIFLEGEDVTKSDPDLLRRRMGYVIQQIGLFPHKTIHDNIATVPRLLGWGSQRIRERVDELLDLVGMDPSVYRGRYPKELSGGQRQRVGVARALSADPPVMLMDEPFGAIDPITRERLQNEFLRLQEEIRKTIVFVTHDIEEAIKMGDRIAILRQRSVIAQYDTPETILTNPADDFVADFIGAGANLKRLNLSRVSELELSDWPTADSGADREVIWSALRASDHRAVLLLDDNKHPHRWVSAEELEDGSGSPQEVGTRVEAIVHPRDTLAEALNAMLDTRLGVAAVVDDDGAYLGSVDLPILLLAVEEARVAGAAERAEAVGQPPVIDATPDQAERA